MNGSDRRVGWEPSPVWPGASPRLPRPGFSDALLLLIVMFVATAVGMVAILLGGRGAEIDIILMGILEGFAIGLALLVGVRLAGVDSAAIFILRPFAPWLLLVTLPLAGACAILMTATEAPLQRVLPMPADMAVAMATLLYPENTAEWVRVVLAAVILIPLAEELLFRGLLLRGFVLRYGTTPALALSSLLFAIVHLNPWGLVGFFAAGWLLGWLVLRSGSLWPAVILHGLFNLTSVLLLQVSLDGPPSVATLMAADPGVWASASVLLLCTGVVVVAILLIERHGRRGLPWTLAADDR